MFKSVKECHGSCDLNLLSLNGQVTKSAYASLTKREAKCVLKNSITPLAKKEGYAKAKFGKDPTIANNELMVGVFTNFPRVVLPNVTLTLPPSFLSKPFYSPLFQVLRKIHPFGLGIICLITPLLSSCTEKPCHLAPIFPCVLCYFDDARLTDEAKHRLLVDKRKPVDDLKSVTKVNSEQTKDISGELTS